MKKVHFEAQKLHGDLVKSFIEKGFLEYFFQLYLKKIKQSAMLGFVQSKPFLEPKLKKPFPIVWLLLGSVFLVFVMYFSYQKSVKKDKNDQIVDISENQKQKFRADSLKLMNCVQYALIALKTGFYERCDGQGKVLLMQGEVYKYGFTCEEKPINNPSCVVQKMPKIAPALPQKGRGYK